jgi:hypothetical protein
MLDLLVLVLAGAPSSARIRAPGRFIVGSGIFGAADDRAAVGCLLAARNRQGVFQTHAAPSRRQLDDSRSVMSDDAVMAERGDLLDLRQRQDSLEL